MIASRKHEKILSHASSPPLDLSFIMTPLKGSTFTFNLLIRRLITMKAEKKTDEISCGSNDSGEKEIYLCVFDSNRFREEEHKISKSEK